jgi:hypothetical protein
MPTTRTQMKNNKNAAEALMNLKNKYNDTRNYINKSLFLAPSVKRNLLKTYNNLPNSDKIRFNITFIKGIEKMHKNKMKEALKEKREKNKLKMQKMLNNFRKGKIEQAPKKKNNVKKLKNLNKDKMSAINFITGFKA